MFRYAQIIRDAGVQEYVFEEMRTVGRLQFEYADKQDPVDYAVEMTKQMQLFTSQEEVREILRHQYVVERLDKERVQEMLELVAKAENTAVIIRSKSFEAAADGGAS